MHVYVLLSVPVFQCFFYPLFKEKHFDGTLPMDEEYSYSISVSQSLVLIGI